MVLPPTTTLAAIETKVRRLTRSPSVAQLSSSDLDNYINTFVVYDFPEQLRTFNLRGQFTFTCNPYQDVYPTDELSFGGASSASQNTLFNFQNVYLTVHPPVYMAGFQGFYSQSPEQFYGIYPKVNSIQSINQVGDGLTTNFAGFIPMSQGPNLNPLIFTQSSVLLQNNVLFSSVDLDGNGLAMVDVPALDAVTGNPTVWGSLYPQTNTLPPPVLISTYALTPPTGMNPGNFINYKTGQFSVTFNTAPGAGQSINSQTVPQIVSLPQAMLFYNNKFTLRPVPDQPYRINFEVYKRPTALLSTGQSPELEEYWQFISYGAARKILQDRLDMDSVALIDQEFRAQMSLCNRRTIVQYTNERTATIYTEQTGNNQGSGWGWGYGGGQF